MKSLLLLGDVRIVSGVLIGTLGLALLFNVHRLARPYARWLAGGASVFGWGTVGFRCLELLGRLPLPGGGLPVAGVGLLSWAMVVAGLRVYFGAGRVVSGWPWFVGALGAGLLLALGLSGLSGGWPFAGPLVVALALAATGAWLLWPHPQARWRGQSWVGLALWGHPLLLTVALADGWTLAEFRSLNPVVISVNFVMMVLLILRRDGDRLRQELAQREHAEAELKRLADSLEAQVQQRTAQLQALNQGLMSFNGMVSHDLRGPLGNIGNLADLASQSALRGRSGDLAQWLGLLRRESRRAVAMVNDLLALAQVDQRGLERQNTEMQALVRACVQDLLLQYPRAEQQVEIGPLPTLAVDPALMRHAVSNLLANALKFGEGRWDLKVQVLAEREPQGWRLSVSDNGMGFDPTRAADLFQPFARLAGERVAGTGLGLTVVQRVILQHGGQVGAEGLPGRGACFWWTVPDAAT